MWLWVFRRKMTQTATPLCLSPLAAPASLLLWSAVVLSVAPSRSSRLKVRVMITDNDDMLRSLTSATSSSPSLALALSSHSSDANESRAPSHTHTESQRETDGNALWVTVMLTFTSPHVSLTRNNEEKGRDGTQAATREKGKHDGQLQQQQQQQ